MEPHVKKAAEFRHKMLSLASYTAYGEQCWTVADFTF